MRASWSKPVARTKKSKGEVAEIRFAAVAIAYGLALARPWGDSEKFDFITGRTRNLWRVQVKSTSAKGPSGGYAVNACTQGKSYTEDEVDFLAAYVFPANTWYIIPIRALRGAKMLLLHPESRRSSGKWEAFREA